MLCVCVGLCWVNGQILIWQHVIIIGCLMIKHSKLIRVSNGNHTHINVISTSQIVCSDGLCLPVVLLCCAYLHTHTHTHRSYFSRDIYQSLHWVFSQAEIVSALNWHPNKLYSKKYWKLVSFPLVFCPFRNLPYFGYGRRLVIPIHCPHISRSFVCRSLSLSRSFWLLAASCLIICLMIWYGCCICYFDHR